MNRKMLAYLAVAIAAIAAVICLLVLMPLSAECYERQQQLKQRINQLNYCTSTDECEAQALYCPFDCWVFANRQADFSQVRAQVDAYGNECGICGSNCPVEPPRPDCIEGKCIFD